MSYNPTFKMVGETGVEPAHFVIPNHEPFQLGHSPMVGSLRIELSRQVLQACVPTMQTHYPKTYGGGIRCRTEVSGLQDLRSPS